MKRTWAILLGIVLLALGLRLVLLPMIHNAGLNDQNHYYNLGRRLLAGEGFTIDYVWHYSYRHETISHPIDHWMPFSGVMVAAGMAMGGVNPQAALLFFILAGAGLPIVVYLAGKQLGLSDFGALSAAALSIALPDILWNSLRTDTTIFNMLLVCGALISLTQGLRTGKIWTFILAGLLSGLAYLNRNDSILVLPMLVGVLLLYRLVGQKTFYGRALLWMPLALFLTISPWLMRNWQVLGILSSPESSRMLFMVDQRDHYAYETEISLETMLAQRSLAELLSKRLFELAAAFKQMLISLDVILPLLIPLGALWIVWQRDKARFLTLSPVLIWLLGILIAYPFLMPYKSQSGSFEKAYLTVLPLLLPLGALAIEKLIPERRFQIAAVVISVAVMSANSYDVVRRETAFADAYYANIASLIATLETMPDVTGDGEIRLMSQDPYVLSYFGYRSVMTPLASREQVLELAERYQLDYLLFPAARPALDDLYLQKEIDPRFEFAASIPRSDGRTFELYAFRGANAD